MKKIKVFSFVFLSILVLYSCKQKINPSDISKLNGYWEIQKVVLPDGSYKEYKINETIDYFLVKNNSGFRQKVMPQLNGTCTTNGIKENLSIQAEKGVYYMLYTTSYGKWKEELVKIEDSVLVVKNKDDIEYQYKKAKLFSLK